MIENETITFSSKKLAEILEASAKNTEYYMQHSAEKNMQYMKRMTIQEAGEGMFGGYLESLLEVVKESAEKDNGIDFTYSTMKNIPTALLLLYRKQKVSYEEERNATIIAKTLASVLYATAMNEHDCILRVTRAKSEPAWADVLSLKLGTKREVDFLKPALEAVFNSPLQIENGIAISPEPLIKAYKTAIGVDLSEKGLAPMLLTAE